MRIADTVIQAIALPHAIEGGLCLLFPKQWGRFRFKRVIGLFLILCAGRIIFKAGIDIIIGPTNIIKWMILLSALSTRHFLKYSFQECSCSLRFVFGKKESIRGERCLSCGSCYMLFAGQFVKRNCRHCWQFLPLDFLKRKVFVSW